MNSSWICPVCHSSEKHPLAELVGKDGNNYTAVRCASCGLIASDPIPRLDRNALQKIYSTEYYTTGWCDGGMGYEDEAKVALMAKEALEQRREIEQRTGLKQGTLLDIGCSDGRYLEEFQKAGWKVAGIEVSEYTAQKASERLGIEIATRPLEELNLDPEQFDLVRLKHCIEHLPDPRSTLQHVARILKPGGFTIIDTDNAEGFRSRMENGVRRLFGRTLTRLLVRWITGKNLDTRYGRLSPPIHLYTFSLSTLSRLLEDVGLKVEYALQPAQGHPIWFPQLHRYRCNPLEALFRLMDDLGGKFGRGEVLVVFARKQKRHNRLL